MTTAVKLADLYEFSTNSGIIIPKLSDVKSRIEAMFLDVFGSDLDVTAETPVGRLIEALTIMFQTTLGVNAQNANQFNINTATGIYLDSLAQVYGMQRSSEKHTQCYITVGTTGIGVTIPAGSLIENSVTRSTFRIVNSIVVPPNENEGRGMAEAVDPGPEPADAGDITIINTGALGWLSVTNESAYTIGRHVETDEEFRARLIDSRPIGMSFLQSVYSRISRINDVSSCVIYENNRAGTMVKNGVPIPSHSIFVCVSGGSDEDIAKAIAETKTPGTGLASETLSYGGESVTPTHVTYSDNGMSLDVYFYRHLDVNIYFDIQIDISIYTGNAPIDSIKSTVEKFVESKGIGARITSAEISRAISDSLPTITPVSVTMSLSQDEDSYSTVIQLDGFLKGMATNDTIDVTIV